MEACVWTTWPESLCESGTAGNWTSVLSIYESYTQSISESMVEPTDWHRFDFHCLSIWVSSCVRDGSVPEFPQCLPDVSHGWSFHVYIEVLIWLFVYLVVRGVEIKARVVLYLPVNLHSSRCGPVLLWVTGHSLLPFLMCRSPIGFVWWTVVCTQVFDGTFDVAVHNNFCF